MRPHPTPDTPNPTPALPDSIGEARRFAPPELTDRPMHDIKAIRDNPDAYIEGWTVRGVENAREVVAEILGLDRDLRAAQTRGQEALAQRNAASKAIGAATGRKDMAEADRLKAEVESLKGQITESEAAERDLFAKLSGPQGLLAGLKNLAGDDVPDGDDEAGNVQVGDAFGTPRTTGPAKDHADLGEALGLIDFEAAAKMSGARFAVLKGGIHAGYADRPARLSGGQSALSGARRGDVWDGAAA